MNKYSQDMNKYFMLPPFWNYHTYRLSHDYLEHIICLGKKWMPINIKRSEYDIYPIKPPGLKLFLIGTNW